MATQYDPIAKDASLNTTENPSRNLADVIAQSLAALIAAMPATVLNNLADVVITLPSDGQTLKYDSVSQKWVNANDAGGHTIENPSGTDMTQRANLQFADAHLTDDSVNDRTEVEVIAEVDEQGWEDATEDGLYAVDDNGSTFVPITGNEIAYDSNTSVNEKIDEVAYKRTLLASGNKTETLSSSDTIEQDVVLDEDLNNYSMLEIAFADNRGGSGGGMYDIITIPTNLLNDANNWFRRPIWLTYFQKGVVIYKNSSTSIKVQLSHTSSLSGTYKMYWQVVGIK